MVMETILQENLSPKRPTSLLLKPTVNMEKENRAPEDVAEVLVESDFSRERFDSTGSASGNPPRRRKKKRTANAGPKAFRDLYEMTGQCLGEGSTGSVLGYRNIYTNKEYAVKTIRKAPQYNRKKILKEIEIFHHAKGHEHILQLIEYFEEQDYFYLVFEKMEGGSLLESIERRGHLTEQEASRVIADLANALDYLHKKGIAHRDLKPENILCVHPGQLTPVKICDFDLGSGVIMRSQANTPVSTPDLLTPVGSAEYMAPEVVDVWQDQAWSYDKRCDIWSLGIILYMLLCGYPPFYGQCGHDCGWEHGNSCEECQENLFMRIQQSIYDFPSSEWSDISDKAKDLISHMLVRDPHQRYCARDVLKHPWVSKDAPKQQLATPHVLQRNNSVTHLQSFAENANAYNRMLQTHLSISEAFNPSHLMGSGHPWEEEDEAGSYVENKMFCPGAGAGDDSGIGSCSLGDGPVFFMGLSPPGDSSLAKRRSLTRGSTSSDDTTKCMSLSPPKTPSSIFSTHGI